MLNIEDYRNAPSGIGPQADEWNDKPHRLIYDLCAEIERLRGLKTHEIYVVRLEKEPAVVFQGTHSECLKWPSLNPRQLYSGIREI